MKYWDVQEDIAKSADGQSVPTIITYTDVGRTGRIGVSKQTPPYSSAQDVTPMDIVTFEEILRLNFPYGAWLLASRRLMRG